MGPSGVSSPRGRPTGDRHGARLGASRRCTTAPPERRTRAELGARVLPAGRIPRDRTSDPAARWLEAAPTDDASDAVIASPATTSLPHAPLMPTRSTVAAIA